MAEYYVYIMTSKSRTLCAGGVTEDLVRRVYEHKHKLPDGLRKGHTSLLSVPSGDAGICWLPFGI